jgi:hypothetical protein
MIPLQFNAPDTPASANTKPVAALRGQHAFGRKADIANLVLATPAGAGTLAGNFAGVGAVAVDARENCLVLRVDEIPSHDERIVTTGSEQTALVRRPFDAVEVALVATQLEESSSWLAHVEDADDVAVGGEGCEHVGVER